MRNSRCQPFLKQRKKYRRIYPPTFKAMITILILSYIGYSESAKAKEDGLKNEARYRQDLNMVSNPAVTRHRSKSSNWGKQMNKFLRSKRSEKQTFSMSICKSENELNFENESSFIYECSPTLTNTPNNTKVSPHRQNHVIYDATYQWNVPIYTEELRLWYQEIYGIEKHAFVKNSKLKILKLQNNRISYISSNAFQGLKMLTELNLSYNRLQGLNKLTFQSLENLRNLNLAHNELEIIRDSTFCGVEKLSSLKLNNNFIESIESHSLSLFKSRQTVIIDISNNRLSTPEKEWLIVGDNVCTSNIETTKFKEYEKFSPRILKGEDNPWDCSCMENDKTMKFMQYVKNSSWYVILPCHSPLELAGLDLGKIDANYTIEKNCCESPLQEPETLQRTEFVVKMCKDFTNNTNDFELSDSNVTVIGIFIVILIPLLLTLSPDCRNKHQAVIPLGFDHVTGGGRALTVNNNNNKSTTSLETAREDIEVKTVTNDSEAGTSGHNRHITISVQN